MQRGMNQTLAWLLAFVLAGIMFGVGGFWIMKSGSHKNDTHEMAAKSQNKDDSHDKPKKKGNHAESPKSHATSDEHGTKDDHGEILRPEH